MEHIYWHAAISTCGWTNIEIYCLQDLLLFSKQYLDSMSLNKCGISSGISESHSACDWAKKMREVMVEYFWRHHRDDKFSGIVEIDESLFGRKVKHHKGKIFSIRYFLNVILNMFSLFTNLSSFGRKFHSFVPTFLKGLFPYLV